MPRSWPEALELRTAQDVTQHALHRIQTSSGLYQMQRVLVDVVVRAESAYFYVPEVTREYVRELIATLFKQRSEPPPNATCQLYFSYGNGNQHFTFDDESYECTNEYRADASAPTRHTCNTVPSQTTFFREAVVHQMPYPLFLHPVVEADHALSDSEFEWHIAEDFDTTWLSDDYVMEVKNAIEKGCLPTLGSMIELET